MHTWIHALSDSILFLCIKSFYGMHFMMASLVLTFFRHRRDETFVQPLPSQFFPSVADSQQGDLFPLSSSSEKSQLLACEAVFVTYPRVKTFMWKVWVIGWCHTNVAAAFLFLFSQALSPHSFLPIWLSLEAHQADLLQFHYERSNHTKIPCFFWYIWCSCKDSYGSVTEPTPGQCTAFSNFL